MASSRPQTGLSPLKFGSTSYRHPLREMLDNIDKLETDHVAVATHTKPQLRHSLQESGDGGGGGTRQRPAAGMSSG